MSNPQKLCNMFQYQSQNLYISGPISSVIERVGYLQCYYAFDRVRRNMNKTGRYRRIYNPMDLCSAHWSWLRCMIVCLYYLITKCDVVYMMDEWESSRGATIEHRVAKRMNKTIIYGLKR